MGSHTAIQVEILAEGDHVNELMIVAGGLVEVVKPTQVSCSACPSRCRCVWKGDTMLASYLTLEPAETAKAERSGPWCLYKQGTAAEMTCHRQEAVRADVRVCIAGHQWARG